MPVIAGLGIGITFVILFSVVLLPYQGQTKQVEALVETKPADGLGTAIQFIDPISYAKETGKSAVVVEVASESVSVKRGSSASIEVIAKHIGGANADQSINVKVLPPIGYTLYPPSVGKSTTPEERFEAAKRGTTLQGGFDLATFMTVQAPSEKAVSKDSQQAFTVMISIPNDLPDELADIFIPINIQATDSHGNAVPGQGTGIDVVVSE